MSLRQVKEYFSLVKFAHTAFALPFALIGYTLGVLVVGFEPWILIGVVGCMVFARNAAMGFNRVIDRSFDAENPRTAEREIPAGKISVASGYWFVALNSAAFIALAATFNSLTLILSPIVLVIVLGYSYTKRFTAMCHMVLGLGLAIAPSAAYIALTGALTVVPMLMSVLVLTWVSGFDIIYALQDIEFDQSQRLHSIPAKLGIKRSLWVSVALHFVSAMTVILIGILLGGAMLYWVGATIFIGLLIYQHLIVQPENLSRIGATFGLTNGIASVVYALFVILDVLLCG